MKLKNGIEILSLDKKLGSVRMRSSFSTPNISASKELVEKLKKNGGSQLFRFGSADQQKNDNFNFTRVEDVLPRDQDYILVQFPGMSKTLIDGYFLDFTTATC
jgi:hypothetical protein